MRVGKFYNLASSQRQNAILQRCTQDEIEKLLEAPLFGIMGSFLGNALFLPQIIKGMKSKSTRDLSAWTYILIVFNDMLWTAFGILSYQPIVYISNLVSVILAMTVIVMKRIYG